MSLSIDQLLKSVAGSSKKIAPPEGQLDNPDIPDNTLDDTIELRDQYANQMRLDSVPRNGTGYSMPLREGGWQQLMDPRKADFLSDGNIDPNTIRSKVDPDSAHPSYSSLSKFSLMPESVAPPHNQVGLIKLSNQSALNYKNRYSAGNESGQSQAAGSAMRPPLSFMDPRDTREGYGTNYRSINPGVNDPPPAYTP